jgi:hypothetical protein
MRVAIHVLGTDGRAVIDHRDVDYHTMELVLPTDEERTMGAVNPPLPREATHEKDEDQKNEVPQEEIVDLTTISKPKR